MKTTNDRNHLGRPVALAFFLSIFVGFFVYPASAGLTLPALVSDGMVLQQGMEVPVWGWATPGTPVRIDFRGQDVTAKAGPDGKWMARLQPLSAANRPDDMTITSGSEVLTITNILVGEVWLCSGQSNMDRTLGAESEDANDPQYQDAAQHNREQKDHALDPLLRQITVEHQASPYVAAENVSGSWFDCRPDNNTRFSAAGFYFAQALRQELNVPVGLIKAAYGGTPIEAWLPAQIFLEDPVLSSIYDERFTAMKAKQAAWDPDAAQRRYEEEVAEWRNRHLGWKHLP